AERPLPEALTDDRCARTAAGLVVCPAEKPSQPGRDAEHAEGVAVDTEDRREPGGSPVGEVGLTVRPDGQVRRAAQLALEAVHEGGAQVGKRPREVAGA